MKNFEQQLKDLKEKYIKLQQTPQEEKVKALKKFMDETGAKLVFENPESEIAKKVNGELDKPSGLKPRKWF